MMGPTGKTVVQQRPNDKNWVTSDFFDKMRCLGPILGRHPFWSLPCSEKKVQKIKKNRFMQNQKNLQSTLIILGN